MRLKVENGQQTEKEKTEAVDSRQRIGKDKRYPRGSLNKLYLQTYNYLEGQNNRIKLKQSEGADMAYCTFCKKMESTLAIHVQLNRQVTEIKSA